MSKFHFARVLFVFAALSIAFTSIGYAQTAGNGSTAQPSGTPPTRASEKADLKNLEAHGYRPSANESNYPNDIQKAEKATNGSGVTGTNGATRAKTPASSDN
ncbi:DUF4148 domain-containing protein [Burkholderia sp. S171]|uniref:DUF4148 domain-containing protein n=1 Tax=Burkholderia sp. S171 TaxID=1641860 RepID=UPI00131EBA25|nr:DUF4148 domain-containing protein [Burkholderia sp. S171]